MKHYLVQAGILLFIFILIINPGGIKIRAIDDFDTVKQELPSIYKADSVWVDSIMTTLSLEEKIGQSLMIAAYSNKGPEHIEEINELIENYNIGGLIFFQGGPLRQAAMINYFQARTKTPLLIAMDAEWGPGMRLDSTMSYPRQMMLGAISDESLIYQMGYDIGEQLKRLGVHVNFAPVVDVNNNPNNPVINTRSFGENRLNVARKAFMYARGLEDAGIIATYKHFPGHGDTDTDSHYSLPVIRHNRIRLDSIELFPFNYGIERGISGIMSAHLNVLALDSTHQLPSSISKPVISDLLRNEMNFTGLIFTDALGMKGISSHFRPGEIEAKALIAGNDILLMPSDVPKALHAIKREIRRGSITEEEIDKHCRRVLFAKAWAGLNQSTTIDHDSLYEDLNDPFYMKEKRKLIRNGLTLLKNQGGVVPLKNLEAYKIASLAIGSGDPDPFSETLKNYTAVDTFLVWKENILEHKSRLEAKFSEYNTLIVSIQETSQWPYRNYGLTRSMITFLSEFEFKGNLILSIFGNPYILNRLKCTEKFHGLLMAYDDEDVTKELAAQGLFGAFSLKGILPVSAGEIYRSGSGMESEAINRLSYGIPEEVNMSSATLMKIDTIVQEALNDKAVPGCQILVSREGKVIFHKAYGHQTYSSEQMLKNDDLFDVASITKIVSTLPALMRLEDKGLFYTEMKLGDYLELGDSCNKSDMLIKDILAHQSGLVSWMPFYYSTLQPLDTSESLFSNRFNYEYPIKIGPNVYANRNIRYVDGVYSDTFSVDFPLKVAHGMYMNRNFRDTIYRMIYDSELQKKEYRYSDLGYYMFQQVIEDLSDTALYPYVYHNFYAKLGCETTGYLPLNRFPANRIVPTENDVFFRHQLLRGHVHDPGAAMLGGICGHAGIFSSANDLAKILQMYLNGGHYGGREFLTDSIIRKYTARVFRENGNRRALGFDKPEPREGKIGPTCDSASLSSYGHTGFTGTMAWVDPKYDLIFVFLSNRIHPNQFNTKLIKNDVRTRIQQAVYDAILPKECIDKIAGRK